MAAIYLLVLLLFLPAARAARAAGPFVICELFVLMLVTFVPSVSLFLVHLLF